MKLVTFADKSLLMGDSAADALLEYARVLAGNGGVDSVTLTSISSDGEVVEASFLLSASTVMMVQSTNSQAPPPHNEAAVEEIRDRIDALSRPVLAQAEPLWATPDEEFWEIP